MFITLIIVSIIAVIVIVNNTKLSNYISLLKNEMRVLNNNLESAQEKAENSEYAVENLKQELQHKKDSEHYDTKYLKAYEVTYNAIDRSQSAIRAGFVLNGLVESNLYIDEERADAFIEYMKGVVKEVREDNAAAVKLLDEAIKEVVSIMGQTGGGLEHRLEEEKHALESFTGFDWSSVPSAQRIITEYETTTGKTF